MSGFYFDISLKRKDRYLVVDEDDAIVGEESERIRAQEESENLCRKYGETHRVYKLVGVANPRRKVVDVDYEEID